MSQSAEYFIAQYVRNPMRREAQNIGVIVIAGNSCAAQFIGEVADIGEIDGRSVKWISHPSVYRKWIKYWREQLGKSVDDLASRLLKTNGDNYDIIRGGFVTDYGNNSPQTICSNLFPLLVIPEKGLVKEAISDEVETDISARALGAEVLGEFKNRQILSGRVSPAVKYPIYHNMIVSGKRTSHIPEFYQHNGRLYVMESINYSTPKRSLAKYHAGYVAKMFDDIRNYTPTTEGIAIVHASAMIFKIK